jgi:hypothetical protein
MSDAVRNVRVSSPSDERGERTRQGLTANAPAPSHEVPAAHAERLAVERRRDRASGGLAGGDALVVVTVSG